MKTLAFAIVLERRVALNGIKGHVPTKRAFGRGECPLHCRDCASFSVVRLSSAFETDVARVHAQTACGNTQVSYQGIALAMPKVLEMRCPL
jgi:hypothetical protein